jgi:hypothetical protein
MTKQRSFKRRVRERMAKTGESYTAARRALVAKGERPEERATSFEPTVAEETVVKATGRGWEQWFELLDGWGALSKSHGEVAGWVAAEHGVSGWWSQAITVTYERARGLRAPGQRADGWSVTASKTVAVPVGRLFEAFEDEATRERWLPGAELRLRTANPPRTARYDWEDGSTRVIVSFEEMTEDKSRIALEHERLPDADAAEEMKTWWRERVAALKQLLESES